MSTVILFDIDNTLTPPRLPLSKEMAQILKKLNVPFHVAAGSDMELLDEQFFKPLYSLGFRGKFNAFLSNGAIHYFCDYSNKINIEKVSAFNILNYLGVEDYSQIIGILEDALQMPEFQLPPDIEIMGEQIAFRDSMINLCPIGRNKNNSDHYHFNRKKFVAFDDDSAYRSVIIEHLKKELAHYIEKSNLTISLGGETSFDIGILHQDKTNAVRTLLNSGVKRIIFFGDALFEGGNDAPLQAFVDNWEHEDKCPLETIQVNCWEDTLENLNALGF